MVSINSYDAECHQSCPLPDKMEIDGKASLIKGVYNRIVRDYHPKWTGFKITTYNDAPAGSGLGTSSTMVVCIIKAFVEWLSLPLGDYEIARMAYEVERKDLELSGGKQDQYAAAFGGFNYMEFLENDMVIVNPLKVKRWITDELELLCYCISQKVTFICRHHRPTEANTANKESRSIEAMHHIKQSAKDMKLALLKGDMREFARILGQAWEDKKKMADAITNCH